MEPNNTGGKRVVTSSQNVRDQSTIQAQAGLWTTEHGVIPIYIKQEFPAVVEHHSVERTTQTDPEPTEPSQPAKRKRTSDASEIIVVKTSGANDTIDRHMSFFKGIVPSVKAFNERQITDFQKGVLQVIMNIQSEVPAFPPPQVTARNPTGGYFQRPPQPQYYFQPLAAISVPRYAPCPGMPSAMPHGLAQSVQAAFSQAAQQQLPSPHPPPSFEQHNDRQLNSSSDMSYHYPFYSDGKL